MRVLSGIYGPDSGLATDQMPIGIWLTDKTKIFTFINNCGCNGSTYIDMIHQNFDRSSFFKISQKKIDSRFTWDM